MCFEFLLLLLFDYFSIETNLCHPFEIQKLVLTRYKIIELRSLFMSSGVYFFLSFFSYLLVPFLEGRFKRINQI